MWIEIGVIVSLVSTAGNWIYQIWRNHNRSVEFFSEIKYITKDGERLDNHGDEELNLFLINKGCPVTIKGIYYDETKNDRNKKWHIPELPKRLERGEVLKIPRKSLPIPFNIAKFEGIQREKPYPLVYALDSFGKKRYVMRPDLRTAPSHQPNLSRAGKE